MKATLLSLILAFCLVLPLHSQNCTQSNTDFETYNALPLGLTTLQVPSGYTPFYSLLITFFSGGFPGVDTTHDAQSGNFAVELFKDSLNNYPVGGDILTTFPCSWYVDVSGY